MPDEPIGKHVTHPGKSMIEHVAPVQFALHEYAELHVTTNFTFLTGASHPEELVNRAADLGYRGIAITDRNSLAGAVRAHVAAKDRAMPIAIGCELVLDADGQELTVLVYPTDRESYGRLCQMLTDGKRRAPKGECWLTLSDLVKYQSGLLAVMVLPKAIPDEHYVNVCEGLARVFDDDRLSIAASFGFGVRDREYADRCVQLARHIGVPVVATNTVLYHEQSRKVLCDVLTCIRYGCSLDQAGRRITPNAEQYLKPPDEMHRLFALYPGAVARTVELLHRACGFSLDQLAYEYPHETCPEGVSPMDHLRQLAHNGARERYPNGVSDKVLGMIEYELALIEELNYPHYFLTVHDIVAFARSRGILCQGRGAAANSAVCFCIGVTSVDPTRVDMLFERFISRERNEPPDIDIDFEHERREEVIQYLYEKYGRHRAALTGVVITYRVRSAIRDVGKALGLSLDLVDRLAKDHGWFDVTIGKPDRCKELGIDPNDRTIRMLLALVSQILGFPRHLSQHVGGFVLTERPLSETVPIENAAMDGRTVIEWDKDDIDALNMLKVDVLALGMLTCIRKCFALIDQHHGKRYEMHTIPAEDPAVYDMICDADTIGVFQIESRAQMTMLPRLRPQCYYDLVIEVAIVRPGPIQGKMVHPYLRRRNGEEPVEYPSEAIRGVLERTLGVPLFQEQAMQLVITAAGFTPGQADQLRRAMAAWKRKGSIVEKFGEKIIEGMLARGYELDFAQRCVEQIKGFSDYGFPESHAASFALLVYVSAWQKCHYPAAFATALINSLPMGFYQPAQIIQDAQKHGVEVRPIDAQHSQWDCTLEPTGNLHAPAIRLGMRLVKGLRQDHAESIARTVHTHGRFDAIDQLWRRCDAPAIAFRRLASADAFGSMGLSRQQAKWMTLQLKDESLPLFDALDAHTNDNDHALRLPAIHPQRDVAGDYAVTGLSLKAHPVSFIRDALTELNVTPCGHLADETLYPHGFPVSVAGLVLVRQRPGTASGITFFTIEDETGIANLIVYPSTYERYRRIAHHERTLVARGTVERAGQVVHVKVRSFSHAPTSHETVQVRARNFH
ncbi:MAG: error-prone DNA polymerase [Phycisphaeraceae bacterium]|nr:error-prone DNA polymerase [Phycisphaerales bacterium]MCB9860855.1 error-prone DNA polymerase [Phycisphaeraceae bacterium]